MGHTKEKLKALAVEKLSRKPGMYCDGGGLWLRVSSMTACSWVFRYMLNKRAREMGLGPYPDITLQRAREKAADYRHLKAEGNDPIEWNENLRAEKKAEAAKSITFQEAAERYIDDNREGWRNQKHAAQWSSTLLMYAYPIIGPLKIQAIDTSHVMEVLQQEQEKFGKGKTLWNARPETAGRVRGRIESVLDWAAAREYRKGENPARWKGKLENLLPHRSRVARIKHHPALPYAEIADFMAVIIDNKDTTARALEFCILTVTRTNETLGARWDEIDIKNKIWTIPIERMKAGKEHRIPLPPRAIEILQNLPRGNNDNFVFRGRNGGQLSNMALLMLLRRLGRDDLTTHGFRSTFRDWAGETTAHPREVIEHALAHQLKDKSEAAYQRGDLFNKRRVLMDDWATACAGSSMASSTTSSMPPAKKAKAS